MVRFIGSAVHELRFGRWLLTLPCLAAQAAPANAQGNVSASVDSAGDLWVVGDDASNNVRIGAGGDDPSTFRIRGGDATTTVNGLPEVTLVAPGARMIVMLGGGNNVAWMGTDYGSDPSCCGRDLVLVTGSGNDTLHGVGPFPSVFADLGAGNDLITWGEGASDIHRALLRTGDGNDRIEIETGLYTSRVEMGAGNDRLTVGWGAWDTQIDMESGDDHISLSGARLDLFGGTGDDEILLQGIGIGPLSVDAGYGKDHVRIGGNGSGARGAGAIEPMSILLGPDDDRLEVGYSWIGHALFDGGTGTDAYVDLDNVFVSGPPDVRAFELPKTTLGPALEIPTRITGRVVAEDGMPVSDAVVFLPELGLVSDTDAEGLFQFDPVVDERRAVELVVGASVRGRARSGAALVELLPFGDSAVGDVFLARELRNVLVYGGRADHVAALEGRLRQLGARQEEVTRLDALPQDLSPYVVIWHLGSTIPIDARQRLAEFVRAGRGLHLSGGDDAQNASVMALVNALVSGGGVDLASVQVAGPYLFNAGAVGGVTQTPKELTTFSASSYYRSITGLEPRNVLFTGTNLPGVPGAVWDSFDLVGGRGHLTLVLDPYWIPATVGKKLIQNLQAFLQREPDALPGR